MEFHDFCELKYHLNLNEINVKDFASRIRKAIEEKYPITEYKG